MPAVTSQGYSKQELFVALSHDRVPLQKAYGPEILALLRPKCIVARHCWNLTQNRNRHNFKYGFSLPDWSRGVDIPDHGTFTGQGFPTSVHRLEPGVQIPNMMQFSAGFERQIAKKSPLAVIYIQGREAFNSFAHVTPMLRCHRCSPRGLIPR